MRAPARTGTGVRSSWVIDLAQGTYRGGHDPRVATLAVEQLHQCIDHSQTIGGAERAQSLSGEGDAYAALHSRQCDERIERSGVAGALQGIGDRPPPENRLAVVLQYGCGECLVIAQLAQGKESETKRLDLRCQRVGEILRVKIEGGGDVTLEHLTYGTSALDGTDTAESFGRTALNDRFGIIQRGRQGLGRRVVTDQPQRKRRHLTNLDLRVLERERKRLHSFWEPDTSDGEGRAAAQLGLGIA